MPSSFILGDLQFVRTKGHQEGLAGLLSHCPGTSAMKRRPCPGFHLGLSRELQGRHPDPPQDCTSRQQELTGVVEEACWKSDPAARSFKKDSSGAILADNTSDLRWKMCQDRRGLAYDQVAILSNEVHARWVALMIKQASGAPPSL